MIEMAAERARRIAGAQALRRIAVVGMAAWAIWIAGCSETPSQPPADAGDSLSAPQETAVEKPQEAGEQAADTSFSAFLALFPEDKTYQDWPEKGQWPIVKDPDFFTTKSVESMLLKVYKPIPTAQYSRIPTDHIVQLDPTYTAVKEPYKSFKYYAFHRIHLDHHWLLGIYAQKQNRNANDEYNGHPFLTVTYDDEGNLIDNYVWWWIEDDMLQVWTEIAVQAETLLTGRKDEIGDTQLEEVYTKVTIGSRGFFKTIYNHPPEESKF